MRLFLFLMCFFTFSLSANTFAQQERVSLNMTGVTVKMLLDEIQRQTDLHFIFNTEQTNQLGKVSVDVKNETVENVLKRLFEGTDLTYSFRDNIIVVKRRVESAVRQDMFQIVGKVTDEKKQPMPGVTVRLEGSTVGTATNSKGIFTLMLPVRKGVLEFSFVGYKTQKVSFTEITKDTIRVMMKEDIQSLDEAVVVAYGTTNKREMTGAVSVIKADEIKGIPSPSIANLLQGRVAGMDITNMSGAPGGGGTAIVIRGYNSLDVEQNRRYSNPLWVVDGVPLNSFTSPITGTNLLADINPDMIESIQVLKDASSAAIYGSRAANGVIIVTTKKGRQNQNATFSVNISQSWNILPELPTVTIGKGERDFRLKALRSGPSKAYLDPETNRYKYPTSNREVFDTKRGSYDYFFTPTSYNSNGLVLQDSLNSFYNNATNFFPIYYEKGKITNANIQTYGGSDRMYYGMGLGYYDESGVLRGTGFNRIDLNANMNVIPVRKLNVDLRLNATLTNRKRGEKTQGMGSAPIVETVPSDPYELSSLNPGEGSAVWNDVLEKLKGTKEKNRSVRIRTNFKIGYDVLDGLNLSTSLAADYSIHRRNYFQPSYLDEHGFSQTVGETGINLMVLNENLLTYQKTIKENHNINVVAGFSYQYDQVEYNGGSAQNSPSDKIYYSRPGFPVLGELNYGYYSETVAFQRYISDMEEKTLISYFGRLEYNYKKKYLLSASFRRDGSSVFGKNNKWGTFPSVAAGWTFTEESFMNRFTDWLSFGKFRASWGRSGQHFEQSFLALGLMESGNAHQGNSTLEPVWEGGLYNDDLSWEETDQYDFGLDLDLFNYRLGITFDYYYRYTDKLLWAVDLPGNYNGYTGQWRNAAAISNEGIELLIKYEILRTPNFYWKVSVNGARNWNRFEKSYNGKDISVGIIGKPLNDIHAFPTAGFINKQDEMPLYFNTQGVGQYLYFDIRTDNFYQPGDYKFIDTNGDGKIFFDDMVYMGSALPTISGGIVSEFRWKNFDLNLSMSYQIGRHMVNTTCKNSLATNDNTNLLHPLLLNLNKITFWKNPGDNHADYARLQIDNNTMIYSGMVIDREVEKVNLLKLKTLTIGYNLPDVVIRKLKLGQVRLFVSGENLLTFSNYSGIDPETVDISTGMDYGKNYPLARKYTLGLTVKF